MVAYGHWLAPLLVLLALSPAIAAGPADEVHWPKDVAEPYAVRVANIERALGMEADYWFAYPYGAFALRDETLAHPEERPLLFRSSFDDGMLKVTILRQDGTDDGFHVNATRTFEERQSGGLGICSSDSCRTEPRFETLTIDSVAVDEIPLGIRFHGTNDISISGPPQAFAGFGEGVGAVRAIAEALGLPVDRIPWESEQRSFANTTDPPPEVERVHCICTKHEWSVDDGVLGTGTLRATLAQGRIVSFRASPFLDEGWVQRLDREAHREQVLAHLDAKGYGTLYFSPESRAMDHDWFQSVFLDHHGLTWRYQVFTHQGGGQGMYAEGFLVAGTGQIVHETAYPVSLTGFESPGGPPIWGVALVVLIAVLLTRRYGR